MATRVLIVDDDPLLLQALRRGLCRNRPDWEVAEALSGEAALSSLATAPRDVVVMDYRMAGMSGLELAKRIDREHPAVRRIMLTGFADLDAAMAAMNEGGVFRFFEKPCPIDQLMAAIEAALEQRATAQGATRALDRLPFGALLIDRNGIVRHRNAAAARLLTGANAPLIDASGRFRGATTADTETLRMATAQARSHQTCSTIVLHRGDRRPLSATVCGLDADDQLVAVYLTDPDATVAPSPRLLAELYGLSPAEARLVAALVRGATVESAAAELHLTIASARTYLKTVFSKMGVTRQTDLVRQVLVAASAAMPG